MYIIKRKRKQKGQTKMDKPETLATLDTQDTQGEGNKNTKTQHRKLKKKKHGPQQKPEGDAMRLQRVSRSCLVKTPVVLLIYVIKSGKSLVGDRGKKQPR